MAFTHLYISWILLLLREDSPMIQNQAASTTLGDIDALAALKEQLEGKK